jgi:RES domain-containing protein
MRLMELVTPSVNRAAIVVRPRKPYLDWASSTDEDAGEQAEMLEHNCTVYLVPEVAMLDELDRWLRKNCRRIFERELWVWSRDADTWPKDRSHKAFRAWFSVDAGEVVIDFGREPIKTEAL